MSNSIHEARQLAAVFKNAAKDGLLEKPFRDPVEAHLIQVARSAGIELVPHTEVTMGTSGRADTIYNRFIVEWKQPGLFRASNNATANSKAIAQLKGYVETFWFSNRQKPGRVVGCCTDGRYFIFATKPGHEWHVSDPVPVDEQMNTISKMRRRRSSSATFCERSTRSTPKVTWPKKICQRRLSSSWTS